MLVDRVKHQAGGSVTYASDATTGCNRDRRLGCQERSVSVSLQRQRWCGAAASARVDFGGRENGVATVASCYEEKAVLEQRAWVFL